MRTAAVAAAGALALLALAAGCGAGERRAAAAAASGPAPAFETTLYFLTGDRRAPIGVRRSLPRRSPRALQALRALLAGPTPVERKRGLATAIPAGTRLLAFRIEEHTTALVDLSGLPGDGAGAVERVRVLTQITRSLVGLSGIERVRLRSDGEPWGLWRIDGGVDAGPYDYGDLLAFFHVCAGKPGTEAVPGDCFSALP